MIKKNKISEAELEIMKIVWEKQAPAASTEIVRTLKQRCGWEDTTIYTMLSKLVKRAPCCGINKPFPIIPPLFRNRNIPWSRPNI